MYKDAVCLTKFSFSPIDCFILYTCMRFIILFQSHRWCYRVRMLMGWIRWKGFFRSRELARLSRKWSRATAGFVFDDVNDITIQEDVGLKVTRTRWKVFLDRGIESRGLLFYFRPRFFEYIFEIFLIEKLNQIEVCYFIFVSDFLNIFFENFFLIKRLTFMRISKTKVYYFIFVSD